MSDVLARRVFRLLLALYPRDFRLAYRDDMELLFAERYAEARWAGRAVRFWIRTVANVVAAAIAERWSRLRGRGSSSRLESRSPNMFGVVQDTRYALRVLRRQPAFSLFVIFTLAVGIGATTAVFSVVDGVLLRPLPYDDSDRLVRVHGRFDPESGLDFPQFPLSNPDSTTRRTPARSRTSRPSCRGR